MRTTGISEQTWQQEMAAMPLASHWLKYPINMSYDKTAQKEEEINRQVASTERNQIIDTRLRNIHEIEVEKNNAHCSDAT